jgi:hypothetical protein
MIVHRAVRLPGQLWYSIECYDREFQVGYPYDKVGELPLEFTTKKGAEDYIRKYIYKEDDTFDFGDSGQWIAPRGTV